MARYEEEEDKKYAYMLARQKFLQEVSSDGFMLDDEIPKVDDFIEKAKPTSSHAFNYSEGFGDEYEEENKDAAFIQLTKVPENKNTKAHPSPLAPPVAPSSSLPSSSQAPLLVT